MSTFEMDGLDDFMSKLKKLENASEIAKKCVDEAAPILARGLSAAATAAAMKGYSIGYLAASIKETKAKENSHGVFSAVRPTGKDDKGVSNMEKGAIMHYGSGKQAATGWITKGTNDKKAECLETMQRKFDEEVETL